MWIVLQIVINAAALWLAAYLVPGITYTGNVWYLFLAGLVMGVINLVIKPVVTLLSLPLIVLTLGLFYLAVNGLMLALAATLLNGLTVDGCMPAILGGIVIGLFNWVVRGLVFDRD